MVSSGGAALPYRVEVSISVSSTIKQLYRKAARFGLGPRFITSLQEIHDRLRRDPLEFGEPLKYLRTLRMEIRVGAISPIHIAYGVNEAEKVVFIREIKLLPRQI